MEIYVWPCANLNLFMTLGIEMVVHLLSFLLSASEMTWAAHLGLVMKFIKLLRSQNTN